MKHLISIFTACLLAAFSLTGCGKEPRSADMIIEDIISYYGIYGSKAEQKVYELLDELNDTNLAQGALWTDIMDYWDYVNNEMPVNINRLPDDLPNDDSLALVVLGYALNPDGTMQDELIGRLAVAMTCAKQYPNAYVICTGGGTASHNPAVSEGALMGQWLLDNGLDQNRLIVENRSLTTAENAEFSYDILLEKYPQVKSVALISSRYHIPWGALMFESAFLKTAMEQQTPAVHVISNCAYDIDSDVYGGSEMLRWEAGGMMQLIGNDVLASQFYLGYDTMKKPPL